MRKSLTFVAAALAVLAFAASAWAAGGSIVGGYGGQAGALENKVAAPANTAAAQQGTLPFTGVDLGLATGGAMLLVITGATMRRATRKKS